MFCRLCFNESDNFLNIFDQNGEQLGIANILGSHFWFKPKANDQQSTVICSTCWLKVNDFHQFYILIERTHSKFTGHNLKEETFAEFVCNEFVDPNSRVKEESMDIVCEASEYSVDELVNPLCELDSVSNKEDFMCRKAEETNDTVNEDLGMGECSPTSNKLKCDKKVLCKPTKRKKLTQQAKEVNASVKLREKHCINSQEEDSEMVKKYIQMNCDMCVFTTTDYSSLRKHFRVQHPKIKFFVRCCDKKLFSSIHIIQHAYKHDNPDFFKCNICQKSFAEQTTLSQHVAAAHGPEEDVKFHCDKCPKKFTRRKQLEFHRSSHVPMSERTFICDQCPKSRFASNDLLKNHIYMRHRRTMNVCHICAKEVRDKASFERHVSTHIEKAGPKVKCTFDNCDHWLKDEQNLRRHIQRIHNADRKAATCEECGRECKDKTELNKHKRRVHSNIVFTCGECKKTFKRAEYLQEHMAQHTGEILYQCPFCIRTFNSNSNMHAHKRKTHPLEWDNWRKSNNGSLQRYSRQLDKFKISTANFNQ